MDGLNDEIKLETQRDIFQRVQDDLQDDGLDKVHVTYVPEYGFFKLTQIIFVHLFVFVVWHRIILLHLFQIPPDFYL